MSRSTYLEIERSDGARLGIGAPGSAWVLAHEGLDDWLGNDYDVSTSPNVLTDGSTVVSKRVGEVDRTAKAVYSGPDDFEARQYALSFFNPKHSYRVTVDNNGVRRWCEGELTGFECLLRHKSRPAQLTFTILCPDPYMRGESRHEASFGDEVPMFGFPYVDLADVPELPLDYPAGLITSVAVYDGVNIVYNGGDVDAMYAVRIEARGTVKRPRIDKDGRHIEAALDMAAGDVLVIDFEASPPRVELNGSNVINRCTRDSCFTGMALKVGANKFTASCANAENRSLMDVQVLYNERMLGV